jgi:hypothetical protein
MTSPAEMQNAITWETLYALGAVLVAWGGIVAFVVWRVCVAMQQVQVRLAVIEAYIHKSTGS